MFHQVFFALSSSDGKILWSLENSLIQSDLMSFYTAQFVHDANGDGVPEILAVHGGDELSDPALEENMFGRVALFDGASGAPVRRSGALAIIKSGGSSMRLIMIVLMCGLFK